MRTGYGDQGARLIICGFPKLLASAFFRVAVAGALALPMHGAGAQDRPAATKVRLVVGGKSAIFYLPLSVTERLGYFKELGLDAEIADVQSGARALQSSIYLSETFVSQFEDKAR